ncbi:HNH endonuclease [Falsiroseomonas sp.]|uniref:HNH endonuclease n=1 Tax=Falsiroseomonas sp. TaxID=2870721 RepID=UPI003F6FEF4C
MAKAVLTTKVDPTYDDLPEHRYHFPRSYLNQVEAARGDWVLYYEPRRSSGHLSSRGGRQAYFATARISAVIPDPTMADHFYALVDSYLDFPRPVPFQEGGHYYEAALQRPDGGTSKGAFGRAVRTVPDREYEAILQAAFATLLPHGMPPPPPRPAWQARGFAADQAEFEDDEPAEIDRPVVERVIARPFRDAAFATSVKAAYGDTCAFTGLKIINGGGRSEVQAAHIRPVAANGPDSLRNGLALCSTFHWMFDRGLVSVDDDHRLLLAKGAVPDAAQRLLTPERVLLVPARAEQTPHPMFLRWHRENVFKG